jgi:ribonuclease Z
MFVRAPCAIVAVFICVGLAANLRAQESSPAAGRIRVTLLGTAGGPPARVGVAGISTLVEAGDDRFLFDAGRGLMQRLVQAGLPMSAVSKLFVTHLHSDHIVDIPDLLLSGWSGPPPRRVPLEVWGPEGTRDMMDHLEQAFAFDIHIRRDVDEHAPASGIQVIARDMSDGIVYAKNGVTITAFLVDHEPVKPAYGYRLNYAGRSVCLSGDTRPSANLVAACRGVDVLIHEAIDEDVTRKLAADNPRLFEAIVGHHTTPEQAADIFRSVGPRLAVFSHVPPISAILERTRRSYSGRLEYGEDLMVIDVGADVVVRRASPNPTAR